jgi:hypothetical protein
MDVLAASGEALFARYAYPPNELGHCGPPGAEMLLAGGASGGGSRGVDGEVRQRAHQFDGAWPYLRLLAAETGRADPLDPAVVNAYWLGGTLLDEVPAERLVQLAGSAFGHQPGVRERLAERPALAAVGASHAFHVFVVYPWVAMLSTGSDVPRSILDTCRVRWGTVESVTGERARVRSQPLSWDGSALGLGPERLEECRWAQGQHAFAAGLRPGEQVALHWDWVCDRLSGDALDQLAGRTRRQLDAVNGWLSGRAAPAARGELPGAVRA